MKKYRKPKNNIKLLKTYITTLIKEESDINSNNDLTFGDLKKIIAVYAKEEGDKKSIKKRKDLGKSAIKLALDFIPFVGAAATTVEIIGKLMNIDDDKKPKGFAGKLDIDDDVSRIVADNLEVDFLNWFVSYMEDKDDNEKIGNFDMTEKLSEFLAQKNNNRSIAGYK